MLVDVRCGTELFHDVLDGRALKPWLRRMESHDRELMQHSLLAGAVASEFCRFVSLTGEEERLLVTGALLHDVGKLYIPCETLQKSGPLSFSERQSMQHHPLMGFGLLQDDGWPDEILEMVLLHHERMDGSGYPYRLPGDGLGKLVRMLMICDVFSALIEGRSYRPSPRQPIEIMRAMTSEFDETLFRVFSQHVSELALHTQTLLNVVEVR